MSIQRASQWSSCTKKWFPSWFYRFLKKLSRPSLPAHLSGSELCYISCGRRRSKVSNRITKKKNKAGCTLVLFFFPHLLFLSLSLLLYWHYTHISICFIPNVDKDFRFSRPFLEKKRPHCCSVRNNIHLSHIFFLYSICSLFESSLKFHHFLKLFLLLSFLSLVLLCRVLLGLFLSPLPLLDLPLYLSPFVVRFLSHVCMHAYSSMCVRVCFSPFPWDGRSWKWRRRSTTNQPSKG